MNNVNIDAAIKAVSNISEKPMRGRPNIHLNFDDKTLPSEDIWLDDVLGSYCAEDVSITLYIKAIQEAATALNVPESVLCMVVLLHELGHWFWHMVLDEKGNTWYNYGEGTQNYWEMLAQLCVVFVAGQGKLLSPSKNILDILEKLMKKQSPAYTLTQDALLYNYPQQFSAEIIIKIRHACIETPQTTEKDILDELRLLRIGEI